MRKVMEIQRGETMGQSKLLRFVSRFIALSVVASLLVMPIMPRQAGAIAVGEPTGLWHSGLFVNPDSPFPALGWNEYASAGHTVTYVVYEDGRLAGDPVSEPLFVVDVPAHPGTLTYHVEAVLSSGERYVGETATYFYEPEIAPELTGWSPQAILQVDQGPNVVVLSWDEDDAAGVGGNNKEFLGYVVYYSTDERQSWRLLEFTQGTMLVSEPMDGVTDYKVESVFLDLGDYTFVESSDGPAADVVAEQGPDLVNVPDPALASAIRSMLEVPEDTPITESLMSMLTYLDLFGTEVSDLTGLEYAANLSELDLSYTLVTDISLLRELYEKGGFQQQQGTNVVNLSGTPLDLAADGEAAQTIEFLLSKGIVVHHAPMSEPIRDGWVSTSINPLTVVGDTVTLKVSVNNVPNLSGFQLEVDFDETLFEFAGVNLGEDWGTQQVYLQDRVTASGNARVVGELQSSQSGIAPNGEQVKVVELHFLTKAPFEGYAAFLISTEKALFFDTQSRQYRNPHEMYPMYVAYGVPGEQNPPVESIDIEFYSELWSNEVLYLSEGGYSFLYASITPSNASNQMLNWSSSNVSVATVNSYGYLEAVSAGTATITATANNGVSSSIQVEVLPITEEFTIESSKGIVGPGEFVKLTVSKSTAAHDMREFRVAFFVNSYIWKRLGVVEHADLADKLESFEVDSSYNEMIVSGTLKPGYTIDGVVNLFTVYLQQDEMIFGEYNEEPYYKLYPNFEIFAGGTIDSQGKVHLAADGSNWETVITSLIPVANPNVDGDLNDEVDGEDVRKVSSYYGQTVQWPADLGSYSEFPNFEWTPLHAVDFNADGVIDMIDLSFVHVRSMEYTDPDDPEHDGALSDEIIWGNDELIRG